jgi:hypothetical protein
MIDPQPAMRARDINALVAVELPAHVWIGFLATYSDAEWTSVYANAILGELKDVLFDPKYIQMCEEQDRKDRDAETALDLHSFLAQRLRAGGLTARRMPPREDGTTPPSDGLYP